MHVQRGPKNGPFLTVENFALQDAMLSQGVPRDAAVNFGATGIIEIKKTDGSTHHDRKRLV